MSGWNKDGSRRASTVFEAAAWFQAVRPICRCGHAASFNPYGLWWLFQRRLWSEDLRNARQRFRCGRCFALTGDRVRPVRIDLVAPSEGDIALPMPDEREWKRAVSRFRA